LHERRAAVLVIGYASTIWWRIPAIVELRDQALIEIDAETRVEIFQAIQDYLQEAGPWAPFLQNGIQIDYQSDIQAKVYHPQWILDVTQLNRQS
jgi:ABC-type transport system substrate-binding protein